MHNGAAGDAAAEAAGPIEARQKLHKLQRNPAVLHVLDDARREGDPERGDQPAGEAPRPARLQGPEAGAEGMRRPALPRLHPAVPPVGPRGADDAELGAAPRLAPSAAAASAQREGGPALGSAVDADGAAHPQEQHAHQQQSPRPAERGALGHPALGQAAPGHVAKSSRLVRIISRTALL